MPAAAPAPAEEIDMFSVPAPSAAPAPAAAPMDDLFGFSAPAPAPVAAPAPKPAPRAVPHPLKPPGPQALADALRDILPHYTPPTTVADRHRPVQKGLPAPVRWEAVSEQWQRGLRQQEGESEAEPGAHSHTRPCTARSPVQLLPLLLV